MMPCEYELINGGFCNHIFENTHNKYYYYYAQTNKNGDYIYNSYKNSIKSLCKYTKNGEVYCWDICNNDVFYHDDEKEIPEYGYYEYYADSDDSGYFEDYVEEDSK